jgi:5,10-methylenetetrahydromethanopterin reductase
LRERAAEYEAGGVTELVYQPAGPDVAGELGRMMAAVGDAAS